MTRIFIIIAFLIIAIATSSVYLNSFNVPFQFDDVKRIVDINAARSFDLVEIFRYSKSRALSYLTFSLNYYFGKENVFGYHLLNLIIHIISSFLVFILSLSILSSPAILRLKTFNLKEESYLISLFAALIFAVHPVQTESVTYIWQRGESMAGMFYLLSLCFYVRFRLDQIYSPDKRHAINLFYIGCLFFMLLSFLSKPTSVTLPAAIMLCEISFFSQDKKEFKGAAKRLLPVAAFTVIPFILAKYDTGESKGIAVRLSPYYMPYYYTKLRVLADALRLMALPLGQRIEYYFDWSASLTKPMTTFYCLMLHLGLLVTAVLNFRRNRIIFFAVMWFYLTLSVTTLLFLDDLFFEHYLYLPLVAYAFSLSIFSFRFCSRAKIDKRAWIVFMVILVAVYSFAAHNRNKVWQSEISLWEDAVKKSPKHARANYTLGVYYFRARRYKEALQRYKTALFYEEDYPEAYYRLGEYYLELKEPHRSIESYKKAIMLKPDFFEAHLNLASVFLHLSKYPEAREYFNNALRLTGNSVYREKITAILEEIKRYE